MIWGKIKLPQLISTQKHAELLAQSIKAPSLILLSGELGSGKTEWVRAFIKAYLKNKKLVVTSPSYSLINTYESKAKTANAKQVVHGDFYRLQSIDDLESTGIWEYFSDKNIICLEWPELLLDQLNMISKDRSIVKIEFKQKPKLNLTCKFLR